MTSNENGKLNGACRTGALTASTSESTSQLYDVDGWSNSIRSYMASKKNFLSRGKNGLFKAVWPHVLLIVLLVVYVICGAITFLYLERPTEVRLKREGVQLVEKEKLRLQQIVLSLLIASANGSLSENASLFEVIEKNGGLYGVNNWTGSQDELKWREQFDEALAKYTRGVLRAVKENFVDYATLFEREKKVDDLWTIPAASLFAFSVVTTIGYGNITPITFNGRLFCIFYGLVGIPFAMLVLANVGKFLSEGLQHIVCFFKKLLINWLMDKARSRAGSISKRDQNGSISSADKEEDMGTDIDQPLPFVCLIGLLFLYICLGAAIMPIWESFSFFDAFYFNFVTITTTGFGDLVPQRYSYLAVTLTYVAVGIAMTTMCIEAAAAYMRKLHYVGRRIQGAKFSRIRFGNKAITLDEFVSLLGVKFGASAPEIARLKTKLDSFVATAIEVRKLNEEQKVAALASFDLNAPNGKCVPIGAPLPLYLDGLIRPFNVSGEDIRYIDDEVILEAIV